MGRMSLRYIYIRVEVTRRNISDKAIPLLVPSQTRFSLGLRRFLEGFEFNRDLLEVACLNNPLVEKADRSILDIELTSIGGLNCLDYSTICIVHKLA